MRRAATFILLALLSANFELQAQERPSQPGGQPGNGGVTTQAGGGGGGQNGPIITLIAPAPMPANFYTASPYIEIDWCDNSTVLVGSTRWIKLDGVTRTSSFTYQSATGGSCNGSHFKSTTTSVTVPLGVHTLSAYICNDELQCSQAAWLIERLAGPMPTVSITPYSADLQDYGRCAIACFAATHAQSTVPYFSLDTPRNVTLVYNGDRVDPRPFIHVDVTHGGDGSNLPSYFILKVQRAGGSWVTFLNGETEMRFAAVAGAAQRLGGQFRAADNSMGATGVYAVNVVVGAVYAAGPVEVTTPTRVIVVNEENAPVARGWMIAGIQRLYPNQLGSGALITEGDGSALYFAWGGTSFVTPAGEFSRLTTIPGTGWRRSYPDSTVVTFDTLGYMTSVRDRWGNRDSVQYDGSNRPWLLRDPVLAYHAFYYDANGLDRINTSVGLTTEVTVQANRTLTAVTDPDGVATTFGYDGSLRLSTVTDRRGVQVAELGYAGSSGKVSSVSGPYVPVYQDGAVRPVTSFTPWQQLGVPTGSTSGSPFPVVRADTARARVTDPGGHLTRFTANGFGQPVRSLDHAGDSATVLYTAAGQVDSVINPLGVNAGYDYDVSGNLTRAQVGGISSRARYHTMWVTQPDSIWGDGQPTMRLSYGANGRADSIRTVGVTGKLSYTYDAYGRVETARDRMGHLVRRSWYAGVLGNHSRDSMATGAVVTYGYDGYGRPTTTQAAGQPTRTTTYDLVGRALTLADGVNANPTRYFYGAATLDSVMDPAGQTYRFGYNPLGWTVTRTDPNGRADSVRYDVEGLVRWTSNRRGHAITQTWDALHRPLVRRGPGIADTTSYAANGDSVRSANAVATETTYLANSRRLVDSVRTVLRLPSGGTRTFVRRYWYRTLDARLDSMATFDRNGPVSFVSRGFSYNTTNGTLTGMRLGTAGTTTFAYDNDLNRIGVFFPDQDSLYQLLLEGHDVALITSPVSQDTLMNDSLGRLTRFFTSDDGRQRVFAYDGLGRLGSTQYQTRNGGGCGWYIGYGWVCGATLDSTRTFGFDAAGNLSGIGRDGIFGSIGLSYTWGNRIQSLVGPGYPAAWSCTYGTDLDGNVTGRSCTGGAGAASTSLYWSADGRLDSAEVGGARMAYRYDAAGRLVRRDSAGAVVSWFMWNGDDLLAELSADGNTKLAEYSYYGLDNLHAVILGTTPYYAHTDAVGNIRGYTSASTRYGTYTYDEFGRLLSGGAGAFGVLERPHWKGALWLEPGADLYYLRNRWYEPFTGRFLSEDPIGLAGGINPYVFAGGEPIAGFDPLGLLGPCPPGSVPDGVGGCMRIGSVGIGGITITSGGGISGGLPPLNPADELQRQGCYLVDYYHMVCSRRYGDDFVPPPEPDPPALPKPTPTRQRCAVAVVNAVWTGATDLAFFTGVGLGLRAARAARFASGWVQAYGTSQWLTAMRNAHASAIGYRAVRDTGYRAAEHAYFASAMASMANAPSGVLGEYSGWDLVPIAATFNAVGGAVDACSR